MLRSASRGGQGWTRSQLNGPKLVLDVGLSARGSSVRRTYSSGCAGNVVPPWTTMRWKFGTSYVPPFGAWLAYASFGHGPVDVSGAPVSITQGAPCTSGLSERYMCESPLSSSTGLPKASVWLAMASMNGL